MVVNDQGELGAAGLQVCLPYEIFFELLKFSLVSVLVISLCQCIS